MKPGLTRELIALRIARELRDGYYVNLGFGLPGLVANFIPRGLEVVLHSENGILGYGRIAEAEEMDIDLVNASGQPVTLLSGASFFHHADSFAMIRGGHIDLTVLGGYQVSEAGDLANWRVPWRKAGSIGGAMDLVSGARRVIVAMEHVDPQGQPRIVKECSYPLTGRRCVDTVVTNLAVIQLTPRGMVLLEVAQGVSPQEVQEVTEPRLTLAPDLKEIDL